MSYKDRSVLERKTRKRLLATVVLRFALIRIVQVRFVFNPVEALPLWSENSSKCGYDALYQSHLNK